MSYYKSDDISFIPFTRQEETELFRRASHGDTEARNRIIENYLQFAASEGLKAARGQFPEDEVLSAANQGLISAVERFDWRRGNGFSCFARQFIRGRVGHLRRDKIQQSNREVPLPPTHASDHTVEHGAEEADWKEFWLSHVRKFISTLPQNQQRAIHCVVFENQTFAEVGAGMKISTTTARRLYVRGIEALRALISEVKS